MAAPTFGAAGTYRQGTTSTPTFDAPASVGANSIVVLDMYLDAGATVSSLPSGFAHVAGSPLTCNPGGGGEHTIVRAWARNPAGATYTVTLSASVYSNGMASRADGCVTSGDPWDTNSGTGTAKATATDVTSGVTPAVSMTTQNNDQLLWFTGSNWGGGNWTPPTGFTEQLDSGDKTLTVATLAQTTAGGTGSLTATCATSDRRAALLGSLLSTALGGTSLNAGNDAVSVAANNVSLAVSASAGNAALSVAGNAATTAVARSTGGAALSVAGNAATLSVGLPAGGAALSVAGNAASLAVARSVGNAALSVAGNAATTAVSTSAGNAALSVAAGSVSLAVGVALSAGAAALSAAGNAATLAVSTSAGGAALAVAAGSPTLFTGTQLTAGGAALAVAAQDVVLRLGGGGLAGNVHGPLPSTLGAVAVHTGTIAGAVT